MANPNTVACKWFNWNTNGMYQRCIDWTVSTETQTIPTSRPNKHFTFAGTILIVVLCGWITRSQNSALLNATHFGGIISFGLIFVSIFQGVQVCVCFFFHVFCWHIFLYCANKWRSFESFFEMGSFSKIWYEIPIKTNDLTA